jgi:hypothetical protein
MEHFPEKHALANAGVVTGFPSENATTRRGLAAIAQRWLISPSAELLPRACGEDRS